jgi:gluconate 2-dehydrogenase gamma chain
MSDITRRDVVRRLGLALMAAGALDRLAAEEVHALAQASAAAGGYAPKAFSAHEYATLERLVDLIIPVENGRPGALAAGAAPWIDMLASENGELKRIYRSGLAWLDGAMKGRGATDFVSAAPEQQTALLDRIAYRRTASDRPELAPGVEFFGWARRMTVDAFYTSEVGIKDIDYRGNVAQLSFPSPTEAIDYALERSKL